MPSNRASRDRRKRPVIYLRLHDQALILRVLGRLSATAMEQMNTCLKAALGIP